VLSRLTCTYHRK